MNYMNTKENFIGQLEVMAKPISIDPVKAKRWVEVEFAHAIESNPELKDILNTSMTEIEVFSELSPDIFIEGYIMDPVFEITGRKVKEWLNTTLEEDREILSTVQDIVNGEGTVEEKFDAILNFAEKKLFVLD